MVDDSSLAVGRWDVTLVAVDNLQSFLSQQGHEAHVLVQVLRIHHLFCNL